MIRRTFLYFDSPLFKKLFITFVRRYLEYGQVIWTPHLKKYITILENVQRRATKLVVGFHHMSFSGRLKRLNIPLLVCRRARGNMIEIFKHFLSDDNCTLPENIRPRNRPSRKTRLPTDTETPQRWCERTPDIFFNFRMIKTWDELPKKCGCLWHLRQSRFPILILYVNDRQLRRVCWVSFYGGAKDFISTCIFLRIITFFTKI